MVCIFVLLIRFFGGHWPLTLRHQLRFSHYCCSASRFSWLREGQLCWSCLCPCVGGKREESESVFTPGSVSFTTCFHFHVKPHCERQDADNLFTPVASTAVLQVNERINLSSQQERINIYITSGGFHCPSVK